MTTPADQPDLIAWLRQQLDDDEERARQALSLERDDFEYEYAWARIARYKATGAYGTTVHRGAPSPTERLAEVDAKRRILDMHAIEVARVDAPAFNPVTGERITDEYEVTCAVCGWASGDPTSACATVRLLALPYADRPGYRDEWRP